MGDGSEKILKWCFQIFIFILFWKVITIVGDGFVFLPLSSWRPPPPCPLNEMFKTCINNCSTCEEREACAKPLDCTVGGCDCMSRFVRLTPGGPCEPVSKCPKTECGDNEVFRSCGPVCERCIHQCRILSCAHRCYCKEGYSRDWSGNCIPTKECPPKLFCTRNDEMLSSGPVDEFCTRDESSELANATQDVETCYCKKGYKRISTGRCMPEETCIYNTCQGVEVYNPCPRKCNTTCRNYGETCEEDGQCYPGCFCPEGYLMNDYRVCVRLEECPPDSNPFVPTAAPFTTIVDVFNENMTITTPTVTSTISPSDMTTVSTEDQNSTQTYTMETEEIRNTTEISVPSEVTETTEKIVTEATGDTEESNVTTRISKNKPTKRMKNNSQLKNFHSASSSISNKSLQGRGSSMSLDESASNLDSSSNDSHNDSNKSASSSLSPDSVESTSNSESNSKTDSTAGSDKSLLPSDATGSNPDSVAAAAKLTSQSDSTNNSPESAETQPGLETSKRGPSAASENMGDSSASSNAWSKSDYQATSAKLFSNSATSGDSKNSWSRSDSAAVVGRTISDSEKSAKLDKSAAEPSESSAVLNSNPAPPEKSSNGWSYSASSGGAANSWSFSNPPARSPNDWLN